MDNDRVFADYIKGTTICAVKKDGRIAVAGDGQVTQGQSTVLKGNAVKVRRIYDGKVVVGFAGLRWRTPLRCRKNSKQCSTSTAEI